MNISLLTFVSIVGIVISIILLFLSLINYSVRDTSKKRGFGGNTKIYLIIGLPLLIISLILYFIS